MLRSAMLRRLDRWLERRATVASRYCDALEHLRSAGIGLGRHYPVLCPDQPACASVGVTLGDLANAHRTAEQETSLPLHPQLDDADVEGVVEACRTILAAASLG